MTHLAESPPCQSRGSFVKAGEGAKWIQALVPHTYFYRVSRAASAANHSSLPGRDTEGEINHTLILEAERMKGRSQGEPRKRIYINK